MIIYMKNTVQKAWIRRFIGFGVLLGILGMAVTGRASEKSSPVEPGSSPVAESVPETFSPRPVEERSRVQLAHHFKAAAKGKETPFELLDSLRDLEELIQTGSVRYEDLVEALSLYMEENPDSWDEFALLVSSEDGPGFFASTITMEALGMQTDSVRAHAVLISLIQHPSFPMKMKRVAVGVLSLSEEVPAGSVKFLMEVASREPGIRDIALDTLARFARKAPAWQAEISRFFRTTLGADLSEGKTRKAVDVLIAIGYSGAVSQVAVVEPLSSHECPKMRGAALIALGMLAPEAGEARLLYALRTDPSPAVRRAALEALKRNPLEDAGNQVVEDGIPENVLQDLCWTARNDSNASVRQGTLQFFHESYLDLPSSVRDTLQYVAVNDTDRNTQAWAQWYLEYGFRS